MRDPRLTKLAGNLLSHSVKVKKNERVLIQAHAPGKPLVIELIKKAYEMGAYPFAEILDDDIYRELAMGFNAEQLGIQAEWELQKYKDIDAVIIVSAEENDAEFSDIPADKASLYGRSLKDVHEFYINNRRWVLLNYPSRSLAQKAGMSTSAFSDFVLDVCSIDYQMLASAMEPLRELIKKTDKVRIAAPGTDLEFSIKGMPAVSCTGEKNLPDGEVYSAPVKESMNGTITFNTPCTFRGIVFQKVALTIENGKVIRADADKADRLNEIFNTDEGARYFGEFAVGLNPLIRQPMGDALFDEKITGSIHLAAGEAYENADNGNRSAIHWDMVLILREQYGGGEIYFDDRLISQNGRFVIEELARLNPCRLNM
ncbi:aminopeptidase [Bacillus marinisedimentorum]|uniref:aminopeptidase n=1 Tax=Bacillus marinisedimentorum TaxID=1821260 RepID=UPI0007E1BCF3|nr:aminopeptidase [Bacillus marinisedimentorum]